MSISSSGFDIWYFAGYFVIPITIKNQIEIFQGKIVVDALKGFFQDKQIDCLVFIQIGIPSKAEINENQLIFIVAQNVWSGNVSMNDVCIMLWIVAGIVSVAKAQQL